MCSSSTPRTRTRPQNASRDVVLDEWGGRATGSGGSAWSRVPHDAPLHTRGTPCGRMPRRRRSTIHGWGTITTTSRKTDCELCSGGHLLKLKHIETVRFYQFCIDSVLLYHRNRCSAPSFIGSRIVSKFSVVSRVFWTLWLLFRAFPRCFVPRCPQVGLQIGC